MKKPLVDPNADAECLLWDVRVSNDFVNRQYGETVYTYIVRVKIFTDGGVNKFGTVELPYGNNERIGDVAGHTIEPDGSIIDLKHDAIFDRVTEKVHREKNREVSFAMPGVKPGAIIEYRYKVSMDMVARYDILEAQMVDMPVERLVFHIKPVTNGAITDEMKCQPFNMEALSFRQGADHYFTAETNNIPAFKEERDAPPDSAIRRWVLIYYTNQTKDSPANFWKRERHDLNASYKDELKVNGDVKQIAQEVTSDAKSDGEKISKLYQYCQKHLKNIYSRDVSDAERQDFKPNKNTVETLRKGEGTARDITLAFVALAQAAGFDARIALAMDRETMLFNQEAMLPYFNTTGAAVNVGGTWRMYEPTIRWLGPGEVRWQLQGVEALLLGSDDPGFVLVPVTPAADSQKNEIARLALDENGNAEGEVEVKLGGMLAAEWRATMTDRSEEARETSFKDHLKRHLAGAVISDVKLSDPKDSSIPVDLKAHVKVEGFATRTGKRLFFVPAVFQLNDVARYADTDRKNDIVFQFPWSEVEAVSVTFPDGFQIDHPDVTKPLVFDPVGRYQTTALLFKNRMLFEREFWFGKNGSVFFPVQAYPAIKKIFDSMHDNDAHMFTLKQEATVAQAQ